MMKELSFQEHTEIGKGLKQTYTQLLNLRIMIEEKHNIKYNDIRKDIKKGIEDISELKNKLDDIVCSENPLNPLATHCYYGHYKEQMEKLK